MDDRRGFGSSLSSRWIFVVFDIDWRGFGSSICSRWILLLFFECLLRWGFGSSKSSRKSLDVSRIGDIIDDNLVGRLIIIVFFFFCIVINLFFNII